MKKSDSATGMIIDVPESMTYKSKFPYPGFWSGAYPLLLESLMKETPLGKENRALVNEALNTSIGMLNGALSASDPLSRALLLITFSHFLSFVLSGLPRQHGVRAALMPPIDAFFPALVSLRVYGGNL